MHKPNHSGKESACYTLTLATAYRMLFATHHTLKPGDNVLVWAVRSLGVFGVQLVAASVQRHRWISDESRTE
jgi:crotonyl-CoA carboxylase/reductase